MSEPAKAPGTTRRDIMIGAVLGLAGSEVARRAVAAVTPPDPTEGWAAQEKATESYAQCGEDVIVKTIFDNLGIKKPTYVDIGAFMPITGNNTYLFYGHGSSGVLIEPNADLSAELKRVRPRDTVLNFGVGFGDKEEMADYYRFDVPQLNTFSEADAKEVVDTKQAKLIDKVKTRLVPINQVMAEHFKDAPPDFFSIDIEGFDLMVLKALDLNKYRSKVICAEPGTIKNDTSKPSLLKERINPETENYMKTKDYDLRATTYPNVIFVSTH